MWKLKQNSQLIYKQRKWEFSKLKKLTQKNKEHFLKKKIIILIKSIIYHFQEPVENNESNKELVKEKYNSSGW